MTEKHKRARIKDVAELAGVSNMTVSRVLNGVVKVSEEKRIAVLDAVEKLEYKPDSSARRLGGHKSYMIGLLYQDLDVSYVSRFLLNALKSSRDHGHHLIPEEINNDIDNSLQSVINLINITKIDGLILLPPISDNVEILNTLQQHQLPFVRITPDRYLDLSPYISIDDYKVGFTVTEHLIQLGHKKIAHIMGDTEQGTSHLRRKGYEDALNHYHVKVPANYVAQGNYTFDSGVNAAKAILTRDDKPSAIFASNDEMAAAVIVVANNLGIDIPNQLSVTGVDDTQLATTLSPNLTTIRQPIAEMAELAVKIIASNDLNKDSAKALEYRNILDFELIKRQSAISYKMNE